VVVGVGFGFGGGGGGWGCINSVLKAFFSCRKLMEINEFLFWK